MDLLLGKKKIKSRFINKLKSQASKLELNKNLTFVGNRSDIREIMSISKIVFSLSKSQKLLGEYHSRV